MALKYFKHKITSEEKSSLKQLDSEVWDEIISAPNQKFMVTANAAMGTSKIKDNNKVLLARARNHSRDILGDENIQINLDAGSKESVARSLLNSKQEKRRKIDDI